MNRRRWILLAVLVGLALALGVGLIAFIKHRQLVSLPARVIRIEISGTPGLKVDGTFEVDGQRHTESGVIPMAFTFRARNLSYTISKPDQSGNLSETCSIDGAFYGTVGGSHKNVRGSVVDGHFTQISNDSN
jgi:hypothetical protein